MRRLTTHDNSEYNGVSERLNRTLLEKVRAMLHESCQGSSGGKPWHMPSLSKIDPGHDRSKMRLLLRCLLEQNPIWQICRYGDPKYGCTTKTIGRTNCGSRWGQRPWKTNPQRILIYSLHPGRGKHNHLATGIADGTREGRRRGRGRRGLESRGRGLGNGDGDGCSRVFEPYEEAKRLSDWPKWQEDIPAELQSLEANKTWSVVERPKDTNVVSSKWVLRIKKNAASEIEKYKARLVARGFTQIHGIDYYETYAPVARLASFRLLLAMANRNGWPLTPSISTPHI